MHLPQATHPRTPIPNPLRPGRSIAAAAAVVLASTAAPALVFAGAPALASAAAPGPGPSGGSAAPGSGAVGTPGPAGPLPSPAAGLLASGGATALVPTGVAGPLPVAGAGVAAPLAPETIQAPVGGAIVGQAASIRGRLRVRDRNRPVLLEYFDPTHGWKVAATGTTNATGAFAVVLRPQHIGRFMFRATTPKAAAATTSMTPIEIYRDVVATIFGPGDYGSRTACGQALTPELLGVAHRTLPCGTMVDITYGSLTLTVPVVDRGPFVGGVSYDLTAATAAALGITETAHIGAVAIRAAAPAAH